MVNLKFNFKKIKDILKIKIYKHNLDLKELYLFTKTEINAVKLGINLYLALYLKQSKAETNKLKSIINHNFGTSSLSRYHMKNPMGQFKMQTGPKITFSEEKKTILSKTNLVTPCKISNNERNLGINICLLNIKWTNYVCSSLYEINFC